MSEQDTGRAYGSDAITPLQGLSSATPSNEKAHQDGEEKPPATKKRFSRGDIKRIITVKIHWPSLYPDYEPWVFKLRLILSPEMQRKREDWLGLTPAERNSKDKVREEVLGEVCDLLADKPEGFEDWPDDGRGPGVQLREYYNSVTDPEGKEIVYSIIEAASNGYWAKVLPREFLA